MKHYKNKMRFFAEADDAAASAGVAATAPEIEVEDDDKKEEVVETAKPPVVDAEALTKSMAEQFGTILERFKPPASEEKKVDELTPEERKKILNMWEPTAEWQKKFDNLETREAALQEMRDGMVRQADTITQFRVREATKELEDRVGPIQKFMDDYHNEKATERFHKKYEELADPVLEPLVTAVTNQLKASGKKFTVEDDLFSAIASGVESIIKTQNPNFKLKTAGSSPATTKKSAPNAIPTTTSGAGGGTGATNKVETPVKNWQKAFA